MTETTIQHIARDVLYTDEKPYSAEFEVEANESVRSTNYILSTERVVIHAIDPADNFELDTHGFVLVNANTSLDVDEALKHPEVVESSYFEELRAVLLDRFPEYIRFEGFEFVVC